jgi:chromosome segregation ATPase
VLPSAIAEKEHLESAVRDLEQKTKHLAALRNDAQKKRMEELCTAEESMAILSEENTELRSQLVNISSLRDSARAKLEEVTKKLGCTETGARSILKVSNIWQFYVIHIGERLAT